jgi:hypothetical protein
MEKEFIPIEQLIELLKLGYDIPSVDEESIEFKILYQQAFRWFREKYDFTYSIGKTNIAVIHYLGTTQLLQNNESYEAAELAAIKWFIDVAKQL